MKEIKMHKNYSKYLVENLIKFEKIMSDDNGYFLENASPKVISDVLEFDYGIKVNGNMVMVEANLGETIKSVGKKILEKAEELLKKVGKGFKTLVSSVVSFIKRYWKFLTVFAVAVGGAGFTAYIVRRGLTLGGYINKISSIKEFKEASEKHKEIKYQFDDKFKKEFDKKKGNKIKQVAFYISTLVKDSIKIVRDHVKDLKEKGNASILDKALLGVISAAQSVFELMKKITNSDTYEPMIKSMKNLINSVKSMFKSIGKKEEKKEAEPKKEDK